MIRLGAVCPKCGSKTTPARHQEEGQDTKELICMDCDHKALWSDFQLQNQNKDDGAVKKQ
jgi:uncharacterized metal-binding protein (TIGR02443 family)